MSLPYSYVLKSALPGDLYVGVEGNVPRDAVVRLQANPAEWSSAEPIEGGGQRNLIVDPYPYTALRGNTVYATVAPVQVREWYIEALSPDDPYTVRIQPAAGTNYFWTAGEPGQPITIQPFIAGGGAVQVFTFIPLNED